MLTFPGRILSKPILLGVAGTAIAAALLGAGILIGRDSADVSPASPPGTQVHTTTPRQDTFVQETIARPAIETNGAIGSGTSWSAAEPWCPALLGPVLTGSVIDLSAAGMTPRLPGDGFTLRSMSVGAAGACDNNGVSSSAADATGSAMLDTQWRHDETGLDVWIHQQSADDPSPSVIQGTNASFSADGYTFQVGVSGGVVYATDMADGSRTEPASPPMESGASPEATALLQTVIGRLAPSLPEACFSREQDGGWEALSSLGVGDPRPAVPAGWTEEGVSSVIYLPPTDTCGRPPLVGGGSLTASYTQTNSDGSWAGALFITANALPPDVETMPGFISDYSVSWSNGTYSFGVYAKAETAMPRDQLLAIARALDPAFDVSNLEEMPTDSDGGVEYGVAPAQAPSSVASSSPSTAGR